MSRVRVVTDSTVRFATPGFLARHPVAIAPLTLRCHLDAWGGSPEDEVVRIVRGMVPRLYLVVFVADLTYLERSGLVTRSQALLGNMLGILPFLTMEDGKLGPRGKGRSRPRAVGKVVGFV